MKKLTYFSAVPRLLPLFVSLLLAMLGQIQAQEDAKGYRTFRSADGSKTLRARVVKEQGQEFVIELEGQNRRMTVKATAFSRADQHYLAEWGARNKNYDFRLEPKAKKESELEQDLGLGKVSTSQWAYKVSMQNTSREDLENIEMHYMVFKYDFEPETKSKKDAAIAAEKGSVKIEKLRSQERVKVSTGTIALQGFHVAGGVTLPGMEDTHKDELAGVWVKIFYKNRQVDEFKSETSALKEIAWETETSQGPR